MAASIPELECAINGGLTLTRFLLTLTQVFGTRLRDRR